MPFGSIISKQAKIGRWWSLISPERQVATGHNVRSMLASSEPGADMSRPLLRVRQCLRALPSGVLTQGSSPSRRKQLTPVARGGNRYTHRRASRRPSYAHIIIL